LKYEPRHRTAGACHRPATVEFQRSDLGAAAGLDGVAAHPAQQRQQLLHQMPRDAPVTDAVLLMRSVMIVLLSGG
jgi:hypothetical protein